MKVTIWHPTIQYGVGRAKIEWWPEDLLGTPEEIKERWDRLTPVSPAITHLGFGYRLTKQLTFGTVVVERVETTLEDLI